MKTVGESFNLLPYILIYDRNSIFRVVNKPFYGSH